MTSQVLIVALGAAAAGFVQGLSGFAYGLVAMSVWAWTLDPVLAGPLVVFGSLTGQLLSARQVLRGASPFRAIPFVAGGVIGVPIGVVLLRYIDALTFKAAVGLLLVVWCPLMLMSNNLPRIAWGGQRADAAVGFIGGVMGGLGGLTGPAPILWGTLRGWDRHTQRVMFMYYNLTMSALTFTTYLVSGTIPAADFPLFLVMVPAMLIPTFAGYRLYHRVDDLTFRRVVLGVLTVSGAVLIVTSIGKIF